MLRVSLCELCVFTFKFELVQQLRIRLYRNMKAKIVFEGLVEKALCGNDQFMLALYANSSFSLWADVTNRFMPPTGNNLYHVYYYIVLVS